MLQLKEIKKSYKTGDFIQHALKGIDVQFRENEFVAILGPSGSGKTTMLNIIGGLDRYDSGDLIINGKSTKEFKDQDWDAYRNNFIGFVFQSYNLINHISVLENVEMGMTLSGLNSKKRKKKALELLDKVGLKDHAHKKPNQLSGGQMQRVAIARALANNPKIIMADEPTGALDTKTSIQIMNLIKEIAKDRLVIMVTHNPELANNYASRIIEFKDGNLVNDSNPIKEDEVIKNDIKIKRTSMNFLTALNLSFNNIITKWGRTLITAFASSIGIIGIALILSLSNGFDIQIDEFEANTLSSLPIGITPQVANVESSRIESNKNSKKEDKEKGKYPDIDYMIPYDASVNLKTHINKIDKEYIDYIENIDHDLVSAISYYRMTNINLLADVNGKKQSISSSSINMSALPKNLGKNTYIKDNYDLLAGKFSENKNEVVLVLDSKNRIDTTLLDALGIDSKVKKVSYNELIGKEFKVVKNNDYYINLGNDTYIPNQNYEELYNNENNITIKIVGIIRGKKGNKLANIMTVMAENMGMNLVSNIGYEDELISEIVANNENSDIVKSQMNNDNNCVFMGGAPFENINLTKEMALTMLGANDLPMMVNIFTKDFDTKNDILNYLDEYNNGKDEENQVIYMDYAANVSDLTSNIMNAVTYVLIAFSAISLIVSSIMIGIITYISVLERTKEIGILRALGARKKDVTRVFNAETFIIGLTSGLLGIIIARLLLIPANAILLELTDLENVARMNPYHALLLIIVSLILTLIGGFIPAIVASKKDPVEALRTE
ncbi:MAG: ABC transporter ATP-binding protein/permease [Tenericutes bacterium]|nr:ABC transporter ATP-binding protein/permease [Mycoplasmatota bacterium]